jgi:hypothetical protein
MITILLLLTPGLWAEQCRTSENFSALVDLILDKGRPSGSGLSVANDQRADKYYASFFPSDLPELHLIQEIWTTEGHTDRIDQWILQFTVRGTQVYHRELTEENQTLVQERQLPITEVEAVACNIFHAFLPDTPGPRWLGSLGQPDAFSRVSPVALSNVRRP